MTTAHQVAGWAAVALTAGLLAAALWSWLAGRRSAGADDHRFAVDRLVLAVVAVIAAGAAVGVLLLGSGARPADPLHVLYGVLALVAVPIGRALGGRRAAASRVTRDAWVAIAAAVLLGIELRLFLTG